MPVHHLVGRWAKRQPAKCGTLIVPTCPAPSIVAILTCGALSGAVDFLIDTGADRTIIMPDDAEALGVKLDALSPGCPDSSRGIGGLHVPVKYLVDLSLAFAVDGATELTEIHVPLIGVLCPPREARRRGQFRGLPSLLGRSFLSLCVMELSAAAVLLHYEG